jgi:predicted dithiol-disulfide oxidoreductase (DUF899 family)
MEETDMLNPARISPPVVSQAEWLVAGCTVLAKEKKAVRLRDDAHARCAASASA